MFEEFLKIGNIQDLLMGTRKSLDTKPVSYFEMIHFIALYANRNLIIADQTSNTRTRSAIQHGH
jgi:hypothetical protein